MTLIQKELKNAYIGEYRVPGENTVAYYPFRSDILDYSGNNKNFTGGAYTFANNKITITSAMTGPIVTPENTTGDRTINVWTSKSNTSFYSFRGSNNGTDGFIKAIENENGNRPGASFKTSSWYRNRPSASDLPVMGDMILMTWIKTGTTMKLYINGVLTSTNSSLNTSTWSSPSGITKSQLDPGTFGEIIIEDKVRTAQEIANYYNSTKGNYESNLKSYEEIVAMATCTDVVNELNSHPTEYLSKLTNEGHICRDMGEVGYINIITSDGARSGANGRKEVVSGSKTYNVWYSEYYNDWEYGTPSSLPVIDF